MTYYHLVRDFSRTEQKNSVKITINSPKSDENRKDEKNKYPFFVVLCVNSVSVKKRGLIRKKVQDETKG